MRIETHSLIMPCSWRTPSSISHKFRGPQVHTKFKHVRPSTHVFCVYPIVGTDNCLKKNLRERWSYRVAATCLPLQLSGFNALQEVPLRTNRSFCYRLFCCQCIYFQQNVKPGEAATPRWRVTCATSLTFTIQVQLFFNLDIYKQQYLSRILCFNHAIVAWPANEIVSHVGISYSNRKYSQRQPSVADRRVTTPAELCSFILNAAAGADAGPVIAVVL